MSTINLGTIIPGETSTHNFVALPGQDQVMRFTLPATADPIQHLNLSIDRPSANVDVQLYLDRNQNGKIDPIEDLLINSSLSPGTSDETLHVQIKTPGTYLARVYGVGLSQAAPYHLKISNTGLEPSDLLQGETSLGVLDNNPTTLRLESLHSADTANLYQFSMATAGNFNAALTGLRAGTNVDMRLIQDRNNNGRVDDGEVIANSARSSNADEFLNIQSLAAGNYFLQTNFQGDASAQYTLKLSNTGDAPSNLLPVRLDFGNLGRPVGTSTRVLESNRSAQVVAFDLAQGSNFNAFLYRNGDSTIRLVHDGNSNGIVDDGEVVFSSRQGTGAEIVNLYGLDGGAYYLQADLGTDNYADYDVLMSNSGFNPSDLLYGEANAGRLSQAPVVYRGSLDQLDAVDTYQFELQSAGTLNAALTRIGAGADIGMRVVYDSNNNYQIDDGDTVYAEFGSGQSDRAINQRLQAGSYWLQAFTRNGVASDYKLKLSTTGDGPSNLLPTETAVGPIDSPQQFYGVVESANTTDTYRFSLSHRRSVTFHLGDLNGNADLRLIRDANHNGIVDPGEEFKRAASLGSSPETITKTLEAGDYFAQVYAPTLEATSYTLTMV